MVDSSETNQQIFHAWLTQNVQVFTGGKREAHVAVSRCTIKKPLKEKWAVWLSQQNKTNTPPIPQRSLQFTIYQHRWALKPKKIQFEQLSSRQLEWNHQRKYRMYTSSTLKHRGGLLMFWGCVLQRHRELRKYPTRRHPNMTVIQNSRENWPLSMELLWRDLKHFFLTENAKIDRNWRLLPRRMNWTKLFPCCSELPTPFCYVGLKNVCSF